MLELYGEQKSNEEIVDFVKSYTERVKGNKHDRFHPIMSMFPDNGGAVLDFGCGWGHYSVDLMKKGYSVTGIDISKNEVDICRLVWNDLIGDKLCFEHKQIAEFEANSFDYVLSNQVIEHVHNPGNYLASINRVLKPNGHLIIALPNVMNPRFFLPLAKDITPSLRDISIQTLENYNKASDHINAWDPAHFTRLVSSVGFLFQEHKPMEGVAFPFRKPFIPYIHFTNKHLRNYSYTMVFKFQKVSDVAINNYD